jgi:tripartite-type tricarboxylate transporter receptor subunit TctC
MVRRVVLLAGVLGLMASLHAAAQDKDAAADYPNQNIKIIVTVPAGGGVDAVTRIIADKLRQKWGQPVIVDNRGGQAGNIGAEIGFAATPDGYTLIAAQPAPLTINPLIYRKLNYDPTQFEPVGVMTSIPNTLTVRPDFPANTVQEFLAYAKANPGKLNYASQGNGTTSHLTAELFQRQTGTLLVHVPYKGTGPAINDLVASHVDLMFTELSSALQLHKAGKAKILALTTTKRSPAVPDVPTLAEAGITGVESGTWNAIVAPPKTPPAIVAKLSQGINEALNDPEVKAHLTELSLQPVGGTPEQTGAFIREETQRWGDLIRAAHVTID